MGHSVGVGSGYTMPQWATTKYGHRTRLRKNFSFQGTDAIKWPYNVMLFGPTNGPATFVQMIHDVDSIWKQYAVAAGIDIGNDVDTTIIIDDIMNWLLHLTLH